MELRKNRFTIKIILIYLLFYLFLILTSARSFINICRFFNNKSILPKLSLELHFSETKILTLVRCYDISGSWRTFRRICYLESPFLGL